jgi:TonB-dependent SusC/RagA subfamily outer membrane receptor
MKKVLTVIATVLLFCTFAHAQPAKISGRVLSSANTALEGVSVQAKGSKITVVTDADGNFTLSVPDKGDVVLIFSYIGYDPKEVPVSGPSAGTVTLTERVKGLNDVIVVGYGTARKRDVTGSVSSIKAEALDKTPVVTPDQMLQGRVSGLQFTQTDGQPGSVTSIRIRGTNSINSGNQPLFVIDGFAGIGDLNSINPGDIESVDVLKDASATAIYGSRGANGVVLITTKKGALGQQSVSFDAYNGVQTIAKKLPLMNATQFAT